MPDPTDGHAEPNRRPCRTQPRPMLLPGPSHPRTIARPSTRRALPTPTPPQLLRQPDKSQSPSTATPQNPTKTPSAKPKRTPNKTNRHVRAHRRDSRRFRSEFSHPPSPRGRRRSNEIATREDSDRDFAPTLLLQSSGCFSETVHTLSLAEPPYLPALARRIAMASRCSEGVAEAFFESLYYDALRYRDRQCSPERA